MAVRSQINEEYAALLPEELAELQQQAEEQQHAKITVPKQTKRAQKLDVTKIANSFQEAVSVCATSQVHCSANLSKLTALHNRTGHFGIVILARSKITINCEPIVLKSGSIDKFFEATTNRSMLTLMQELDAWCVGGLRGKFIII